MIDWKAIYADLVKRVLPFNAADVPMLKRGLARGNQLGWSAARGVWQKDPTAGSQLYRTEVMLGNWTGDVADAIAWWVQLGPIRWPRVAGQEAPTGVAIPVDVVCRLTIGTGGVHQVVDVDWPSPGQGFVVHASSLTISLVATATVAGTPQADALAILNAMNFTAFAAPARQSDQGYATGPVRTIDFGVLDGTGDVTLPTAIPACATSYSLMLYTGAELDWFTAAEWSLSVSHVDATGTRRYNADSFAATYFAGVAGDAWPGTWNIPNSGPHRLHPKAEAVRISTYSDLYFTGINVTPSLVFHLSL